MKKIIGGIVAVIVILSVVAVVWVSADSR